jgi:hypothetical protein
LRNHSGVETILLTASVRDYDNDEAGGDHKWDEDVKEEGSAAIKNRLD